jgi:hypothetical protein
MKRKDRDRIEQQEEDEASRKPDAWEQFRILVEVIDQGRRLTEMVDHKARYALVLIGVVNAAMILLATRADFLQNTPEWLAPWLKSLLIPYIGATGAALWYAISSLRPRTLDLPPGLTGTMGQPARGHRPSGLLLWESIATKNLESYQQAWGTATLGQLNAELVIVSHKLAEVNRAKFAAVTRLYSALVVVIALAAGILACDVWFSFLWEPLSRPRT